MKRGLKYFAKMENKALNVCSAIGWALLLYTIAATLVFFERHPDEGLFSFLANFREIFTFRRL